MEARDLVEQIVSAALAHKDLPDAIVAELIAMVSAAGMLQGREEILRELLGQLRDYDPYAGAGCFGGGSTLGEIRQSIDRIQMILTCS